MGFVCSLLAQYTNALALTALRNGRRLNIELILVLIIFLSAALSVYSRGVRCSLCPLRGVAVHRDGAGQQSRMFLMMELSELATNWTLETRNCFRSFDNLVSKFWLALVVELNCDGKPEGLDGQLRCRLDLHLVTDPDDCISRLIKGGKLGGNVRKRCCITFTVHWSEEEDLDSIRTIQVQSRKDSRCAHFFVDEERTKTP